MINLTKAHFFSLLADTFLCIQEQIPEVLSLRMQCPFLSVMKAPE